MKSCPIIDLALVKVIVLHTPEDCKNGGFAEFCVGSTSSYELLKLLNDFSPGDVHDFSKTDGTLHIFSIGNC